jgi:lipoate---protein ligase
MPPDRLSLIDVALSDPSDNLRLDEDLLHAGNAVLRLWETVQECVVLGRSGRAERDVNLDLCQGSGIPVLRRCSGGGAVLLGPGCLNYSLVLPIRWNARWRDVRYSFEWTMTRVRRALGVPGLRNEGSDLALDDRKVSGNAQRRSQTSILHHGTILYCFDGLRAEHFLKPPLRAPQYRDGRSHRDFLGNVPLGADEIRARLVAAWC